MTGSNPIRRSMRHRFTCWSLGLCLLLPWMVTAAAESAAESADGGENEAESATLEPPAGRSNQVKSAVAAALAAAKSADDGAPEVQPASEPAAAEPAAETRSQQLMRLVDQAPAAKAEGGDEYLFALRDEVAETLVVAPAAPADEATDEATEEPAEAAEGEVTALAEEAAGEAEFDEYKVRAGDSLWSIAADHLGDGNRWLTIYEANRDELKDVDFLRVGQVLLLPDDEAPPALR